MSFSGRLNAGSSVAPVVPLSIGPVSSDVNDYRDFSSLVTPSVCYMNREQRQMLAEELVECRTNLVSQNKSMQQLKEAHELQLLEVSRQLLELEFGLRKRERELCLAIRQRDNVIRQQANVIRFLAKKTGTKRRDILSLASEAEAKIPQLEPESKPLSTTSVSGVNRTELTSILESESENDSAIILDDASPTSTAKTSGVSRSVSDVTSPADSPPEAEVPTVSVVTDDEDEDHGQQSPFASAHYRGFLLRHGSYERYKIRSRMQQMPAKDSDLAQVAATATLPRSKTNQRNGAHLHVQAVSTSHHQLLSVGTGSSTVIVVGGNNGNSPPLTRQTSSNHRNVTKPRDVKNRSSTKKKSEQGIIRTRNISSLSVSPSPSLSLTPSLSPSPPLITDHLQEYVQKGGSVFCSPFFVDSEDSQSLA